jgi:hypothetical protein
MDAKYVHFTIYDDLGNIISSGMCQEEAYHLQVLNPGEYITQIYSDPEKDTIDTITKNIIPNSRAPDPITYIDARRQVYPSIAEQLDMLWHAMHTDTIPKAEPFYTTIKLVKDAYPKDNSATPGSTHVVIL